MAKKQREPIKVEAFINIGGVDYNLDEMTAEQRNFVGAVLKVRCLNAMFAGQATFSAVDLPPVEEVFPVAAK